MKQLFPHGFAIFACIAIIQPGSAQTLDPARLGFDPTRLGEGVRPLAVPELPSGDTPTGQALEDENDFAPESPGDDDIGQQLILKDSERERWLNAQASTALFWTDNPANLSSGANSDVFSSTQFSLAAQPRLAERLYLDAFISQQIYRYDKFSVLDYEYLQGNLGVVYLEPRLWDSALFVQGQFGRTTADNFNEDIYNNFSVLAGIQKTVVFDRRNSLYLNLMGDWDAYGNVDDFEHAEYIADVSYRFKIMRDLVASASYRLSVFDYYNVDRRDVLNVVGLFLNWAPEKWINIYAGCTFNFNESDIDVFDYDATNLGGGLGIQIRF
ncbi:MAG: hypothetical protein ACRDBP_09325 [Luteolibacter sp.]